jgi:hypothetical protein
MITPKMRDEDIGEIFHAYEKTVTTSSASSWMKSSQGGVIRRL